MKILKNRTFNLAFCAVITALSLVMMFMTGLLPFMTYALPGIAGMLTAAVVIESSKKWALYVYAATSAVSLMIAPDKEAAVIYAASLGYYPILKSVIERIGKKPVEWVIKLAVFNAAIVAAYAVLMKLMVPAGVAEEFGDIGIPVLLLLGNITFIVYDIALTRMITLYLIKIRDKIFRKNM